MYLAGIASVVGTLGRVAFHAFLRQLTTHGLKVIGVLLTVLLVLSFLHHVLSNPLSRAYAALDARQSPVAAIWQRFDAWCSRSFCSALLPSPIRNYELHVKEAQGFDAYIQAIRAKKKAGELSKLTPAQRFVAEYIPPRSLGYTATAHSVSPDKVTALYLTGTSARPGKIDKYLDFSRAQKLTGIVFDIKDVYGFVNYRSTLAEVKKTQGKTPPPLGDLLPLVEYYKSRGFYTVARIALNQDELQAKNFPDRQIKLKSGGPLLTKGRTVWVDPNKRAVEEYNLAIIREVLQAGVDEIQLDYVRYPAEGDWKIAEYHGLVNFDEKPRIIGKYLQKLHALTRSYGAYLSLDVFGVVAWQEALDIKSTGQDMHVLSQATDILSPMLYPSHFGLSFGGVKNPADKPALFLEEGVQKLKEIAPHQVVRPWVQAFKWRVTNYSPAYITEQVRGSNKAGGQGYLLWNAGNNYEHFSEP